MKYNYFRSSIACLAIFAMLCGCQKEEIKGAQEQKEDIEATSAKSDGKLVAFSLKSSEQADEAYDNAIKEIKTQLGAAYEDYTLNEAQVLFNGKITGMNWQLETYRIHYKTVDINGEEIILAGDVAFLNESSKLVKRELNSVTLFHTQYNTNLQTTTTYEMLVTPTRGILYNSLLVYPFYQGIEIDEGIHTITISEPLLKARQAIDCEVAALELIDNLENVRMKEGYCTYNAGASNGGGAALATQYLLETDSYYKAINKETIHLKSTYCAEGCYSYRELIPLIVDDGQEASSMDAFKGPAMVAIIVGSYDTWKAEKSKHYFDDIESVGLLFSEEFNSFRFVPDSTTMEEMSIVDYFRTGTSPMGGGAYDEIGIPSAKFLNPELFKEDGTIDMEHPYIKALNNALSEGDVLLSGWYPATQLCLAHSLNDEFVNISQPEELYRNLGNNGWNKNVIFKVSDKKFMNHILGTLVFSLDIMFSENPCEGKICR